VRESRIFLKSSWMAGLSSITKTRLLDGAVRGFIVQTTGAALNWARSR
jgi:hypothetical protein